VLIVIITTLASLLFVTKTYAETISPFSTEQTLVQAESSNHTITFSNENDYNIYVTPRLYKYYPQSEYILDLKPFEEFVKIDNDYITVPASSSKDIRFQIVAPNALEVGTYYNLIVFEHIGQTKKEEGKIGASAALSHIVQLNIINDYNANAVTEDYNIELSVVDRGIPFIRPAQLKLLFFNNSKYTLVPQGEIQITKSNADKEPEYIKVNLDRTRVYPEDSLEKTYEVKNWYIEDILYGKKAYLKIENGLDKNMTTKEIDIPGFKNEFLYIIVSVTVIILLVTSLKGNTKPKPKRVE
jgi:hypothetical protein